MNAILKSSDIYNLLEYADIIFRSRIFSYIHVSHIHCVMCVTVDAMKDGNTLCSDTCL
jgi:hypothetical protein